MNTCEKLVELIGMGWTQSSISNATGVSQGTISRIANGEHKDPRASSAYSIDRLYDSVIKESSKAA